MYKRGDLFGKTYGFLVGFYGAVRNRTEGSVAKFQLVVRRLLLFLFSKRFAAT